MSNNEIPTNNLEQSVSFVNRVDLSTTGVNRKEVVNSLWRVYRTDDKRVKSYELEMETNECLVIAPSAIVAKGLALLKHPDFIWPPHVTKKDILVELLDMSTPRVIT